MSKYDQTVTLGGTTVTLTNETRFVGSVAVRRYRIITTNFWVYNAYEPMTTHSTITTIEHPGGTRTIRHADGEHRYDWFGTIGTQNLPADIDALPRGEARYDACKAWRASEAKRANEAIVAAFPEAAYGERRDSAIEVFAG